MSDNPVETTATEAQPSTPVPATPPVDVEAIKKAARAEALREAQAAKDRELARLHKEYQTREKELKAAAAARLQKVGFDQPDDVFEDVEIRQKARQFDAISQEAQQAAEWQNYVEGVATAYGLTASDPRLSGAVSAQDLQAKAKAAMLEEAAKERERALADARKAATAAAQAKVDNGDLDVLGGAPSAPAPGLMEQYNKEMLAARGKGLAAGTAIRDKYRAKGLNV